MDVPTCLIFAQLQVEAGNLLDASVQQFDRVGLLVNLAKTTGIAEEAKPLQTVMYNQSWGDSQNFAP